MHQFVFLKVRNSLLETKNNEKKNMTVIQSLCTSNWLTLRWSMCSSVILCMYERGKITCTVKFLYPEWKRAPQVYKNHQKHIHLYRIAGNFRGRKLSQILWFLWVFCASFLCKIWGHGRLYPLARHKRAIHESFLGKNHIFHQFMKVFSLESFPLCGI